MRRDTRGWIYYFDHSTCSTTWQRPTADMLEAHAQWQSGRDQAMQYWGQRFLLQVGPIEMTGMERLFERTFRWKIAQFRYRCLSNSTPNFVKITVSRTNVFEDSFQEIMNKNPLDLRRRLYIEFRNEEQDASQISYETSNPEEERLDYDGVAREWFFLVSHEMLNPVRYLFMCAGNNNNSLQINPASFALFHGKFIHSGFMMPFYKKMLNKRIMLKDIEQVDFDLYNRMTWIKNNNIDERPMNLYFLDDYELRGEWKTHELKPGGAETLVTEATKDEYIDLFIQWRFNRGVEQQTQAFVNGFYSVFPLEWLQNFDERELELLLCGMQDVDVDDWESNTVHRGYAPQDEQLTWFWQWVRSLNQERHARLLQFVTGTCRVLVGGFSELMGSTGPQLFCIERVDGEDRLPRSRTCFNQLDLPPYRNYAHLAETLTAAIDNTEGFGNE
ncbi:hypothetical protein WR25_24801 isoform B [Diploscapter pachys]|nr:hypothetical protein WR25_24801 isoform B [Diploscapter pachys]